MECSSDRHNQLESNLVCAKARYSISLVSFAGFNDTTSDAFVRASDYKYANESSASCITDTSMNNKYDVVVIGGGHNGLVNAAYLARAGKKVLVLERRHVLGGAAVTEEVFPGFKFSVCSYVVSLLRPEIIRDLDLPRHGLEILPLDGTFTPMPSGDYLWRVNDHAKTRREIARHSKVDAEAYEEYGKAMVEMGRFVKPILNMTPPDPTSLDPRGLMDLLFLGKRFRALSDQDKYNQVQLMTMSAVDFLDQWLSLIHISEPTRLLSISYAVFCLKKKKNQTLL